MYINKFNTFNAPQVFSKIYLNPERVLFPQISVFKSYSAIKEYYELVTKLPCFIELHLTCQGDCITFWTVIEPNNYDSRDKVLDLELEMINKYPDKQIEFKILDKDTLELALIPKTRLTFSR